MSKTWLPGLAIRNRETLKRVAPKHTPFQNTTLPKIPTSQTQLRFPAGRKVRLHMKALKGLSSSTKRLFALSLLTMAAAIPAFANCSMMTTTCPDGASTGADVCCQTGGGFVDCACTSWSSSTGYSGCFLIAGCN